MPIEIVFDMLGFNMLNPKMKNHPPFVLPRLANMQRSQHTNLKKKDSFWFFCLLELLLRSAKTHKSCKCTHLNFVNCNYAYLAVRKDIQRHTKYHQILRLPRKMNLMTDPRHIWNAIYNARNKYLFIVLHGDVRFPLVQISTKDAEFCTSITFKTVYCFMCCSILEKHPQFEVYSVRNIMLTFHHKSSITITSIHHIVLKDTAQINSSDLAHGGL